jgi:hypothetical protein
MAHKNKPPAFQFYVNDWASSLQVRAMTPAQRGCYIDLLAASWPDGIPAGMPLWTLTACRTEEDFDALKDIVLAQFKIEDGVLVHSKLAGQWKQLKKYHKTQQYKAKKGANARWHASGTAQALPDDASSSSTSSSISSSKKKQVNNNQQARHQSKTDQTYKHLSLFELYQELCETLELQGDIRDLKGLPDLPTEYLKDAVSWASSHTAYWSRLRGKTVKDFVRACLKENALLDQFEKARKAGCVHPDPDEFAAEDDDVEAARSFEVVED